MSGTDEPFPGLEDGLRAGFDPPPPRSDRLSAMRLSAGQMLTCYEVVGPIGKGGMGEVYRARDTRLEREVALKVLPAALVEDEEHLTRFRREAKLLASLNHPNVATIHGLDQVGDIHFLVLELVPGETLSDRIVRGALPVADAVRISQQIAAGLEAAHETGIVHRDLKPANVIVRPDGTVKILDFGLAKQTEVPEQPEGAPLTQAFQIMGTPGYMSPEQARGDDADHRTDVWAFGCILYECLVGTRAFPGANLSESLQALFEREPDLEALPAETPPTVRLLVSRCLAKESAARLRAIGDVKLLLQGAIDEPSTTSAPITIEKIVVAPPSRALRFAFAAALLLVATLAAFLIRGSPRTTVSAAGTRTLALPFGSALGWLETSANLSKLGGGSSLLSLSPDARRVAYCARADGASAIYLHEAGAPDAVALDGTANARAPFFSPDGERVGFLEGDVIQAVSVGGGAPQPIHRLGPTPNFSACWTWDGEGIVFATRKGLHYVSRQGTDHELLTKPDPERNEVEHLNPSALPDGDGILLTVATGTSSHVAIFSRSSGTWRTIVPEGGSARYAKGYLFYARGDGIQRARFDPAKPEELGLPQPVQDGVFATPCAGGGSAIMHFDLSHDGVIAFAPATEKPTHSAALWVARDSEGVGKAVESGEGNWKHPRLAPGCQHFTLDILRAGGTKDVHICDVVRGFTGQVTHDGMSVNSAIAPDSSPTLRSTHRPQVRLGDQPPFLEFKGVVYADSWTPDGKTLVLTLKQSRHYSLWTCGRDGGAPTLLLDDKQNGRFGQVSPDGRWLAYVSDVREQPVVFVRPYPALDYREKISPDGGGAPVWSKDGSELFYRRPDGTMIAVAFETEPRFDKTGETELFRNDYDADPYGHQHYDVSQDGQRFLMIRNDVVAPNRILVVAEVSTKQGE